MTSDSRIGLMAQLEEARKEIEYYRRLAREAGNIRLRETEELSNVIGDLRRTKQVLEQEKLRFLSLAEQAPYAMAMISPAGHFLYVNPKFEEMFGYDLSEIPMGRDWFRKAYPNEEYRHQVIAAWLEDHARSGSGEQRHRIFAVTCKDGREKIIHFRPVQFQTGEHLMTCEDITERTRAREALERSEANYRAVLDSMNDAVFVHDAETGAILDVNNKMSEMYGYTRREATCLTVEELSLGKPPYTQEETAQWITRAVEQGPQLFAWLARDKTGRLFWVEVNLKVAVIGGERRILAVVRDITDRKKAEEALRQSELRYRTLVEESFDGIFVQEGSRIVFANSKLCRMLGYEEGELEGKEHWEVYGPAYHDLTRERAQARMRGEQVPSRYEVKLQRKDGASFDGEISAKAVKLGEERGIQVWVRDISQRKRVEEALRESEERLRLAWDTSPEAFSISRLNDGVYVDVNRGYLDLTGYSREEVIGKSALDLPFWQNPADRQPLVSGLTQDGYVRDLETRIYRKDGELRTVLISGGLMMLHGEPHLLAITKDVEKLKQAQEALKESEQRYRTLFEESIDGVYSVLREGEITDANVAFCKIFGYTREETIGKNILELYSDPADRPKFQEQIEKSGFVKDYPVKFKRKDGKELDCLLTSSVHYGEDGRVVEYRGIMRDVTDQQLLQRQLLQAQKMEAIGTLAGGIAHDVNNLLQAVLGYSDLLLMKKGSSDPDAKKLKVIQQAARDGADLVTRILTFSRKGESKTRPIDLNEVIRKTEKLLRRTLPRMIEIDLALAADIRIIDADPSQVEQVILNLGVNAQHAMPNGGRLLLETSNVSVSDEYLRAHLGAKAGKYVLLTVSDTGIGIEPEVLDRIFEPFFTTKPSGVGTGLGLSMVHGIVTQHGGYIRCYSEQGQGTSFKIYFPVSKSELAFDPTLTREMPAFGSETILLVDDDNRIREMGKQVIEMGGYKVLITKSGEEALEVYSSHKEEIALVILDLIMPGMGGKRCLEELLRIDPNVKVLVASGYSSNGVAQVDKGSGARGFISKPYDAKDILTAIRRVLDRGTL